MAQNHSLQPLRTALSEGSTQGSCYEQGPDPLFGWKPPFAERKEGGHSSSADAVLVLCQSHQGDIPPGCPDAQSREAGREVCSNRKYAYWIFKHVAMRIQMGKSDLITDRILTQL